MWFISSADCSVPGRVFHCLRKHLHSIGATPAPAGPSNSPPLMNRAPGMNSLSTCSFTHTAGHLSTCPENSGSAKVPHLFSQAAPVLWQSEALGCCSVSPGLGERWILASKVKAILVNSKVLAEEDRGCDILMSQLPQLYFLNFLFE
ncbi:unnamed protein product [Leuciscus chuanchicus]